MIIYMKNCLWLTIILISIIYVSCERNSIIDVDYVRAEKPNNVVSVDIDTTFMCEFPEISDALDIQVIRDSIIIVHDKVSDANIFHFKAYSLDSFNFLGEFITNGRSSGEMISPHIAKMLPSENDLYISQTSIGKSYAVDVQKSIYSGNTFISEEYDLLPTTVDWLPLGDSLQLMLQYEQNEFVYQISGNTGESLHTYNLFDGIDASRYATYLSQYMIYNRNLDKVAISMIFFPQIAIIDLDGGRHISTAVDKSYKNWQSVLYDRLDMETIQYYTGITVSDEQIFAAYRKSQLGMLYESGNGSAIHVFDWDGKFKNDIRVKENIGQMAFDYRTKYLYCIEKSKGNIIRYDLKGL